MEYTELLVLFDPLNITIFVKANVIPPEKLVSPVADAVRKKLATVAWGRKRLGLPVIVRNFYSFF